MDLEIATLTAKDGNAKALIKAMDEGGSAALLAAPGCHSVKALRGVENPDTVVFLVEWESVDAHNAARDSEGFRKFIEIAGPFFGGGGQMQHFRLR